MTLNQLEYYVEVASGRSYSKAAQKLFVSQSTLSKAVNSLECEFGVTLIERKGNGIVLTSAGEKFLDCAREILNFTERKISGYRDSIAKKRSRLTIGIPPTAGGIFFHRVLTRFGSRYLDTELAVTEAASLEIEQLVLERKLDLGVVIGRPRDTRLHYIPVLRSEAVLVVGSGHPLADRESVQFRELKNEKIYNISRDFMFHDLVLEKFRESGTEPDVVFESGNWELIYEMTADNQGCCILPRPLVERYPTDRIRCISLCEPSFEWILSLVHREDAVMSPQMKAFINLSLIRQ